MAKIRITDENLSALILPTTSIGDGSKDAQLTLLPCRHPVPWRSLPIEVPVDARTARRLRIVRWAIGLFPVLTVLFVVAMVGTVVFMFQGLTEFAEPPIWQMVVWYGLSALATLLQTIAIAVACWLIMVRTPWGVRTEDGVRLTNVDPAAAREWVALNRSGAVVVTDWQGARPGPVRVA